MRTIPKCLFIGIAALFVFGFRSGENGSLLKPEMKSPPAKSMAKTMVRASGSLSGIITYPGEAPATKELAITKDQRVCGKVAHDDESLLVGKNNGIKNVLISIENIPASKGKDLSALGTEFVLDQTGCLFSPHVRLVPVGVPLQILNNDGILHNIHTYSEKNKPMNIAQPRFKKVIKKEFDAAEIVSVKCDVHGWMSGYIVVVDHPYHSLTNSEGYYEITDIPAGSYQARFWHEKLGTINKEVTIMTGEDTKLDFTFFDSSISEK